MDMIWAIVKFGVYSVPTLSSPVSEEISVKLLPVCASTCGIGVNRTLSVK
jgi:hypothetical protein